MPKITRQLNDDDLMPWGKYEGWAMINIPPAYYHWLWTNGKRHEHDPVAEYIRASLSALSAENPDLIWD